jgi:outer membrane protein assembly factor BamB
MGGHRAAAQTLPDTVRWSVTSAAPPAGAPIIAGPAVVVPLKEVKQKDEVVRTARLTAYRIVDGSELWTTELAAERPLAGDDRNVYVASGEAIHALDAASGTVAWRLALGGKPTAPPLAHGGWVLAAVAGELIAIRSEDGGVVWRKQLGSVEFRPSLDGDLLIVPIVEGRIVALDLQNGEERWRRLLGAAPTEPYAIGDRVYVGSQDKIFYSVYAKSGRVDFRKPVGAMPVGRATVDDRHVYFAAMDNMVHAYSRRTGAEIWKRGLPYRPAGGPILIGTLVSVPGYVETPLPAFHADTGEPAGTITFSATLIALPVFTNLPGGKPVAIGVTGGLNDKITVLMLESLDIPPITVQPLTTMPGEEVPLASLTAPVLR